MQYRMAASAASLSRHTGGFLLLPLECGKWDSCCYNLLYLELLTPPLEAGGLGGQECRYTDFHRSNSEEDKLESGQRMLRIVSSLASIQQKLIFKCLEWVE